MRHALRAKHYSLRTERAYVDWARRYVLFHGKRHPRELGPDHVNRFLTHLAVAKHVAASTQNQALSALLFLSREVLGLELDGIAAGVRARPGQHLPVVLGIPETVALLGAMEGTSRLMAELIYGGGLRVSEC